MSKAPAMPIFIDAYLSDTTHLSTEEHGAYLLLLMAMWRRNGSVPDDDRDVARMVGLGLARWKKIKERLRPLLTFEQSQITQKRLKKEWNYVTDYKEKQRKNAEKRWAKAKEDNGLSDATAYAKRHAKTQSGICTHTQEVKEEVTEYADRPSPITLFDGEETLRKSKNLRGPTFEEFWKRYPRKRGKQPARKSWKLLSAENRQAAIDALPAYEAACKETDTDLQHGSTYLSKQTWKDFEVEAVAEWHEQPEAWTLPKDYFLEQLRDKQPNGSWFEKKLGRLVTWFGYGPSRQALEEYYGPEKLNEIAVKFGFISEVAGHA